MTLPSYQDLERRIDECMLADRFAMRRQIKKKNERQKLAGAIDRSAALVSRRRDSIPQVIYPDTLPVAAHASELRQAIERNQVIIVAGETGSGKTTQLPKICLEAGRGVFGRIGHTQPRRVAARTIAHRLAHELQVAVGEAVGYQVRFQDQTRPETLIKVMTDGILLAETQNDRFLERYDTLIIDEAHERSLNIDFLLGYIRRILPKRPDLKVIITSATIDVNRFSRHFGGAPIFEVSGRTYPVDIQYHPLPEDTEDSDVRLTRAILDVLAEIDEMPRGDVLIFLPGEREIRETSHEIRRHGPKGVEILPLYSRLSIAEQDRVFQPHTGRRVVLATNVAETSLTVPGIRYVIDPGLARISRYSLRSRVQQLPVEAVSQASANQRAGRCGRVSEGVCFRLYSIEDFESRPAFTEPEILRTNLASVILQMLQLRLGDIGKFPFVERPDQRQINDGYALLFELQAVNRDRQITRMGKQLASFPLDLRFARMLIAASQMGCLHELLVIASALTVQDPRERPFDHQQAADEKHRQHWHEKSDFLALTCLWTSYEEQRQALSTGQLRRYCRENFLSYTRMREWREVHRQLLLICREQGLKENRKPAQYSDVHRAILTGLLGHIAHRGGEHDYRGARNRSQYIFPGSSQFSRKPKWIVSAELAETSRLYARTVAEIESRWIEPLAGHLVVRNHHDPVFDADKGQVLVREEVSLYGMVIVSNRMVDFAAVDQANARELFIEKALVQGELKSDLKFYQHNRRLKAEIEHLESKARKRDILIESRALFEFYDQLLPREISSELELRSFVNARPANSNLLQLSREELMRREAALSETLYPNQLTLGSSSLPLDYKFEPGSQDDGVSVDLPLVLLNQVPRSQLDWIVPGLLKEKCLALIKSLPKSIRKHFVPAPDYVERVLENFEYDGRELTAALADRLFRLTGTRVAAEDFQAKNLDTHLSLNIRVRDETGKVIASSRDLDDLVARLGETAKQKVQSGVQHGLERQGLVDWDWDDLPETLEVQQGGVKITLYPGLIDDGDSVSIRLLNTAWEAAQGSKQGLLRLFLLKQQDQRKFLENNIPGFDTFSLYYATRGTRAALTENIVKAVFSAVFVEGQPMVRSREAFEQRLQKKSELFECLEQLARILAQVLQRALGLQDRLKQLSNRAVAEDLTGQLDALLPADFPAGIPFEWLRQYPRYLKGIEHRLERLQGNGVRDAEIYAQLRPWLERWQSLDDESRGRLVHFRWMLEEFRISLFAQSIGTSMPVSDKRLSKEWTSVMGMKK